MSKYKSSNSSKGMGLCSTLLVVFLVLKLSGLVEWSWWVVMSPFWGPLAVFLLAGSLLVAIKFLESK